MATQTQVQYVSDAAGKPVSVIVPIELWQEIESAQETAYLFQSETMKQHPLAAKARGLLEGIDTTIEREPDRVRDALSNHSSYALRGNPIPDPPLRGHPA